MNSTKPWIPYIWVQICLDHSRVHGSIVKQSLFVMSEIGLASMPDKCTDIWCISRVQTSTVFRQETGQSVWYSNFKIPELICMHWSTSIILKYLLGIQRMSFVNLRCNNALWPYNSFRQVIFGVNHRNRPISDYSLTTGIEGSWKFIKWFFLHTGAA